MTIHARPNMAPLRLSRAPVFEVHPNAAHTGTLTLDYGLGRYCPVDLLASYSTLLLALVLARTHDDRRGQGPGTKNGGRTLAKLAGIYGTLPGALFGHVEPATLFGYKSCLLKLIEREVAAFAAREQVALELPTLIFSHHGQGYRLSVELELHGVDLEALLAAAGEACD